MKRHTLTHTRALLSIVHHARRDDPCPLSVEPGARGGLPFEPPLYEAREARCSSTKVSCLLIEPWLTGGGSEGGTVSSVGASRLAAEPAPGNVCSRSRSDRRWDAARINVRRGLDRILSSPDACTLLTNPTQNPLTHSLELTALRSVLSHFVELLSFIRMLIFECCFSLLGVGPPYHPLIRLSSAHFSRSVFSLSSGLGSSCRRCGARRE